jgi:hypothetical protein
MKNRKRRGFVYAIIPVLVLSVIGGTRLLGVHTVQLSVEDGASPDLHTLYLDWDLVLNLYVTDEGVDYPGLVADPGPLFRFASLLSETGPHSRPDLFLSEAHELAYNLNAYNALVLVGVVKNWPISSVRDVRGFIEPRSGFGFFWAQRFQLDGETINLYDLENRLILQRFHDGRIHSALNCASRGCPPLRAESYDPGILDEQLEEATRAFVNQERYLHVDEAQKRVFISAIFDWYRSDFLPVHASGLSGVLEWVVPFAQPQLGEAIREAIESNYSIELLPYDWQLNSQ